MPGTPALRSIAGDIQKVTLLATLGALIGRYGSGKQEPALGTFPERQTALRTDVPLELPLCSVAAKGACLGLFVCFHGANLLSLDSLMFPTAGPHRV